MSVVALSGFPRVRLRNIAVPALHLEKIDQDHRPRASASPPKTLDVELITPACGLVRSTSRSRSAQADLSQSVPRTSPPVTISPSTARKSVKALVVCLAIVVQQFG